jgi:hypothetical protein
MEIGGSSIWIAKRIDWFLISDNFLEEAIQICQLVTSRGDYNHILVLSEVALPQEKPTSLFKLKPY